MALEIANVIHAACKVAGGDPPSLLMGVGFSSTVTRSAAGVYQLQTVESIDASEAIVLVNAPAFGSVLPQCNGRVSAPGVVDVVISAQNAGVDPPYFDVEVQRIKSGAVALPAVTPPIVPTGQFVNVIDPPDPYFANPGERVIYTDASGVGIHQLNLPQPGVPGWVIQVIVLARTTFPNLKAQVLGGAEIYNAQPTNDDRVSPDVQPSGISPLGGKTYEFVGGVVGWLITGFNGQAA